MIYTIPKNTYDNWLTHIQKYPGVFNDTQKVVYFYSVSYGDFETACGLLINRIKASLIRFYSQDSDLLMALRSIGFSINDMLEFNPEVMFKPGYHPSMRRKYFSNIDFSEIVNSMKLFDLEEFKQTSTFEQFLLNYLGESLRFGKMDKFNMVEKELSFMSFQKESTINLTVSKWVKYLFIVVAMQTIVSNNEELALVYLKNANALLSNVSDSVQKIFNLYHHVVDQRIPYLEILRAKDRKAFNTFLSKLSGYDSAFAHILACN